MNIIVYVKTGCPWAAEVIRYLRSKSLSFETRNMTDHPEYKTEIENKTGQSKSPTLDIDGTFLPDAGVEEVSKFLEARAETAQTE